MYVAIRDSQVLAVGYKDVITGIKDLGLESFELNVGRDLNSGLLFDISKEEKVDKIISRLESENVSICALLVANDFVGENVEGEIQWVADVGRAASALDIKTVRINPVMKSDPSVDARGYAKLTAKCIKEILRRTEHIHVSLAMENHGIIGNNREYIQDVISSVKSERLGLTLDTGNLYWYGYPLDKVYEIIESLASYVKHTHVKNLSFSEEKQQSYREPGEGYPRTASPLYAGDIDLRRVLKVLKTAGYNGDLTIEDESLINFPRGQRLQITREDIEYMKSII
jgi:sugar phosphate isomerase/epimerase